MYKTYLDEREHKIIIKFGQSDRARIDKLRSLFEDKGFSLTEVYLKKLTSKIWELRSGRVRLLFGIIAYKAYITNVFIKKSQKTPLKEIKLAEKRFKEYL